MPYIRLMINIFVIFSHALFDLNMAICRNLGKSLFRCCAFQTTTYQKHTSPFCSSYQARCSGSLQILQYYLMTSQEMNM